MVTQIKNRNGIESKRIEVNGLSLHCLEAGTGEPVLLLHGWPTNAQLWRHVLGIASRHRRVIALDLPGFGESEKPLGVRYTYQFYADAIDGALSALGVESTDTIGLGVHDMGGPIGLFWAARI